MKKYDVLVVGCGPAGISASVYARRAGLTVCAFDAGNGKLEQAKKIANYYGFDEISGAKLKKQGISQAKKLGVDIVCGQVVFAEKDFEANCFNLRTQTEEFVSRAIVIASGEKQNQIDGRLKKFEKQNISTCAICDGFFYRGKTVGVLGAGEYAFAEAEILSGVAEKVYVFSDGKTTLKSKGNIFVVEDKIVNFLGETKLEFVETEKEKICVDGLFVALGFMDSLDLAKKLGVLFKENSIVVNEKFETNIPGAYSAGDITGGIKQIATAVYQGMVAGLECVKYVKK